MTFRSVGDFANQYANLSSPHGCLPSWLLTGGTDCVITELSLLSFRLGVNHLCAGMMVPSPAGKAKRASVSSMSAFLTVERYDLLLGDSTHTPSVNSLLNAKQIPQAWIMEEQLCWAVPRGQKLVRNSCCPELHSWAPQESSFSFSLLLSSLRCTHE